MTNKNYLVFIPVVIVSCFNVCYTEYKMKKMYSLAELSNKKMYEKYLK
jgi:hypothetical protein